MNRIIISLVLLACAGCSTTKHPPEVPTSASTEVVTITIKKVNSAYEIEGKWIQFKSSDKGDVLAAPQLTGKPNVWAAISVVQIPKDYCSSTKILIDGEMIGIPSGFGTTLNVMVTPTDDHVHAKGIFSVSKVNNRFEVPFDGIFELGIPTTIYERKEYFGTNVYTNSIKGIEPGRETLF